MDDQRYKAFLVRSIISAQATIDSIRADLKNPGYLQRMTDLYATSPCGVIDIASDKIEYQKDFIVRAMNACSFNIREIYRSYNETPTLRTCHERKAC